MNKKTASLDNFIGIYDGYITKEECNNAIKLYEDQQKINNTFTREAENTSSLRKKDTSYAAFGGNHDVWVNTLKPLMFNFDMALRHYETKTGVKEAYDIPNFRYTTLKIQKTLPTEGYHVWHLEHGSFEISHALRGLVFTVYLNDVEEGGETEFLHFSKRVNPKTGRIVIWPSSFPYLHRGNPPLSGEKYILTSWLLI